VSILVIAYEMYVNHTKKFTRGISVLAKGIGFILNMTMAKDKVGVGVSV